MAEPLTYPMWWIPRAICHFNSIFEELSKEGENVRVHLNVAAAIIPSFHAIPKPVSKHQFTNYHAPLAKTPSNH
jgi:hypothetical protein